MALGVTVAQWQATTFRPRVLFGAGDKGVWYDPSDSGTVFTDAAATTPATDGDQVGCILDKSGNDYHATQSTSTAKPYLRNNGGLWSLEFDGVDDHLNVPSMSYSGTEDFMLVIGAERDSNVNATCLWNMGTSGFDASLPGMSILVENFGAYPVRMRLADSSTFSVATDGAFGNTGDHVVSVSRPDVYIDGVRGGWSATQSQSFASVQTRNKIGCRDVGFALQQFWDGHIYQLVFALFKIEDAGRASLERFAARKQGITL